MSASPRPASQTDDEPVGTGDETPFAFDESPVDLDDREAEDVVVASLDVENTLSLVGADDDESMMGAIDPLDDDVARAGSWIASDAEEPLHDERSLAVDRTYEPLTDDVEGVDESAIDLGALPPLDRGEDDADGPLALDVPTMSGAPGAFSMSAPSERSFVAIAERDAEALLLARSDTLRTNDGVDRAAERSSQRRSDAPEAIVAAVRDRELIAFCFAAGPGKVSRDGGETFTDAPWMQGATALAARGGQLFAAVYDAPVDRCTIVRDDGATVERVVDVHSFVVNDELGCAVRALVVLDDDATQLLLRTATASFVVSLR